MKPGHFAQNPFGGELVRQQDSVRVLPFSFVLLSKNLFDPLRLAICRFLIGETGVLQDDELFAATVTPKRAHFLECWCPLSGVPFLDGHCFH